VFQAAGMAEDSGTDAAALGAVLQTEAWWNVSAIAAALRAPLLRACAAFLTQAGTGRMRTDPVARFHLGNGARLQRVNWLANVAPRGIKESYGIMVNYLYDPRTIEANHEAFVREGVVARSAEVESLLSSPAASPERRGRARSLSRAVLQRSH
jgi:malonyl-CoA decarboxylase